MAVEFQNGLSPTALTTAATQSGPSALRLSAWSESLIVGVIQVTFDSVPAATSLKNCVGGVITFAQSGPLRMWLIARKADQFPPALLTGAA